MTIEPLSASLVILSLAVALLAPAQAAGQGESREAKELASLIFSSGQFDQFVTLGARAGTFPVKASLERRLGRQLTDDESRRVGEIFLRVFQETIPRSDFEAHTVDLITRYYSQQELKELVAFYYTPLGQKALRFASVSTTAKWVQQMTAAREHEFIKRFNAEFARELPMLNQELQQKPRQ
jgi:hypothetical protein